MSVQLRLTKKVWNIFFLFTIILLIDQYRHFWCVRNLFRFFLVLFCFVLIFVLLFCFVLLFFCFVFILLIFGLSFSSLRHFSLVFYLFLPIAFASYRHCVSISVGYNRVLDFTGWEVTTGCYRIYRLSHGKCIYI